MERDDHSTHELSEDTTSKRSMNYPAIVASMGSIALSLYLFYGQKSRMQGIFVGLWAPTFLGIASYLRLAGMDDDMDELTGSRMPKRMGEAMEHK